MSTDSPSNVLVFAGSWRRNLVLVLLCSVCAFACIPGEYADEPTRRLAWAASALFAGFAAFFVYQASRRLPRLTLTSEGFELHTGIALRRFGWHEYEGFRVKDFVGPRVIAFRRADTGADGAILNQFEADTDVICEALCTWRNRYGHGA